MKFTEKKTTHTECSYSGPGILEKTIETNQIRELKAAKVRFTHSKFRIVHAQHKQQKPLLFKLALRSLFKISQAHSLLSCLACEHFISNLTNHELQKKLANQKHRHVLASLRDSNQCFALICRHYTEGLECLWWRRLLMWLSLQDDLAVSKIPLWAGIGV